METRANYALIGAFTLAVAFAAFAFVYWFSGPRQIGRQETYQIIFPGSVSGLSRGAAVLFNGVKVGEVTHLAIDDEDPSRVDVLIKIDKKTPVKTNTRVRLETKGFTGVAEVLLVGGTPGAPDLTVAEGQRYPQIQADRSEIQNLLVNVQQLSTKASDVLAKLEKLLDENGPTISATLKNAETFTKTLSDNSNNISSLLRDATDIAHSLKPVAAAIDPRKLKSITGDIARFSASGLRQYEQLAVEGRKTLDTLDRAVRALERDPSQVIFGPSQNVPEIRGR